MKRNLLTDHHDLDEWIQMEDALDAMHEGQNIETFVLVHKPSFHSTARAAYMKAIDLIAITGSWDKAMVFVQRQIQLQGASDAEVHTPRVPEDRRSE